MTRLASWLVLVLGFGLSTAASADVNSGRSVTAIGARDVAAMDYDEIFVNEKNEVLWNGQIVSEPELLQLLKQAQSNGREPDLEFAPAASESAIDKVFVTMFQHGFYPLINKVMIDDKNHMLWNGAEINSVLLWDYLDQLNKKYGSSHYIQFEASSDANKITVSNTLVLLEKSEGLVEDLTNVEVNRN